MERYTDVNQDLLEERRLERTTYPETDLNRRIDENGFDVEGEEGLLVDRCTREQVSYYQKPDGSWHPNRLRRDDDVIWCGIPGRVVGPASGRTYCAVFYDPWFGDMVLPIDCAWIEDRAPVVPDEDGLPPMPLNPPSEEPAPDNDPSTAPNVPGKTERRLYFGPGAASDAPPVVTDLAGSGEKATLVGAGLQVAQRTERIWSYETSPITTAVSCPTTADFWETAAPILPGDTAGFWAASGFLLTSQSVPTSAGRHLLSSILSGPARGWYQAFAGTNASLQCGAASAANTFVPSTTTFAAADVGKLFLLFIVYDAVAGRVRSFIRRAEVGTGAVISGYAPSGGIIRITNGVLSASPGEGFAVLGFMCGLGIPTLSEIQSSTDAFLASDGDFAKSLIANKTSYAMQFRGLTAVPNEIAPIVGTIPMVRNGSPTLVPQYARAAGW